MRLVEGQLIHGRYRLSKRLAQGGMGEVWKAYDLEAERCVAVKALRGDFDADISRLERLRAEAKNSEYLAHPNIAALFDYYENRGMGFLIMEYIPWPALSQIYKAKRQMEPKELLPIISQIAKGLYAAHCHGVIHRDIKPANIMVSPEGKVKITDFGVSYSAHQAQITKPGMVVGTAQYISPEQAQGKAPTERSDIYSLGVVFYEGLAGYRPFTGKTPVDIAASQVNDPVPQMPPNVNPALADYVMVMLDKDPCRRPRSAMDVAKDMDRLYGAIRGNAVPRRISSYPHPMKCYIHSSAVEEYRLLDAVLPSTKPTKFEEGERQ